MDAIAASEMAVANRFSLYAMHAFISMAAWIASRESTAAHALAAGQQFL
jgi:hypothetical protein